MTVAGTADLFTRRGRVRGNVFRSSVASGAAVAFVVVVVALVFAPLASLLRLALTGDTDLWDHLVAYVLPPALAETLLLLAGVAVVASVAGVGTACIVTTFEFPGRKVFIWMLPLPLAIPTYISAYVYADLLDALGPVQSGLRYLFGWRSPAEYWFPEVRSLAGAVLVIGFVLYPYVYLGARAMLQTQGAVFAEAAHSLGAGPWKVVRGITLPLARPALAVGLALALLEALNDIGASEYLGVRTLTTSIFTTWLNRGSLSGAAQIAVVMLVVVIGLIGLERYGRRGQRFAGAVEASRVASRIVLRRRYQWIAVLGCLLPVALGFLMPAGFLVHQVIRRGLLLGFDPELVHHTIITVMLASAAAAGAVIVGFAIVLIARLVRSPQVASLVSLAGLGYALPGTVLALGLLSPFVAADEMINAVTRALSGATIGLVLAGSSAALITAYIVRFLAIPIGFAQAGLARVPASFDDSARSLGAGAAVIVGSVHLPLIKPALWGAALLVFVDCLKELPATLLLRPLNVQTLSTYIYQFASRGSFEEGALAALIIVAVGVLPVIYMVRFADLSPAPASN